MIESMLPEIHELHLFHSMSISNTLELIDKNDNIHCRRSTIAKSNVEQDSDAPDAIEG